MPRPPSTFAPALVAVALAACNPLPPPLAREQLMDPANCAGCHPDHYRQWSGSMHAYAAEDPVFLAMNRRGQRETAGALGDFCVRCHAPLALELGLTKDGSNLAEVPKHLRGVTCYFCHTIEGVEGTHNAPLRRARGDELRGALVDPRPAGAHESSYSRIHDRNAIESAPMCGACHDIVTPAGVHLERTFKEWQGTLFAKPIPSQQLTCGSCHMTGRDAPVAAVFGAPSRLAHDHSFPGVDVALTDFPEKAAQRARVQAELDSTLATELCVEPDESGAKVTVRLDNVSAGHGFPSGALQDRRAWVEITAEKDGVIVGGYGRIGDFDPAVSELEPARWVLWEKMLDDAGKEVHQFWEARRLVPEQLSGHVTNDPNDPRYYHIVSRTFPLATAPDRVKLRVRMRPIDVEVLDSLVRTGDLDPSVVPRVPTYTLASTVKEWNLSGGWGCVK